MSTEAEIDSEFDGGEGAGDVHEGRESLAWPSSGTRISRSGSNSGGGGGGGGGCCHHAAVDADADPADHDTGNSPAAGAAQDGASVLRGFRRLLWFWSEYYLRGGRDRLSLEFSTHVKFWAWKRVIRLLCADDGSPTALVSAPLSLPRSPYDAVPRRPSSCLVRPAFSSSQQ